MSALQQILLAGSGSLGGTWSTPHRDAAISLSGGDLIATAGGSSATARSVYGNTAVAGVKQFRVTVDASSGNAVGIGIAAAATDITIGTGSNTLGYQQNTGAVKRGGTTLATLTGYGSAGNIITVQVDDPGRQVRFALNGGAFSAWYSYATFAGSVYAAANTENNGDILTLNPT